MPDPIDALTGKTKSAAQEAKSVANGLGVPDSVRTPLPLHAALPASCLLSCSGWPVMLPSQTCLITVAACHPCHFEAILQVSTRLQLLQLKLLSAFKYSPVVLSCAQIKDLQKKAKSPSKKVGNPAADFAAQGKKVAAQAKPAVNKAKVRTWHKPHWCMAARCHVASCAGWWFLSHSDDALCLPEISGL